MLYLTTPSVPFPIPISLSSFHICTKRPIVPADPDANSTHLPANKHAHLTNLPANTDANTLYPAFKHAYMDPRDCHYYLIPGPSIYMPIYPSFFDPTTTSFQAILLVSPFFRLDF